MVIVEGLKLVFLVMKEVDIDNNILVLKFMEVFEKMVEGKLIKLVLFLEVVNFLGIFKGIKEVMSDDNKEVFDIKEVLNDNELLKK